MTPARSIEEVIEKSDSPAVKTFVKTASFDG